MGKRSVEDSSEDIENNFTALINELRHLREELSKVKREKWRDRVIFLLLVIIAGGFIYTNLNSNRKQDTALTAIKAQAIGGVVSNCAFTNIQSSSVTEFITDLQRSKKLSPDEADKERARFQRIDCVGLVSDKGNELSVCLQYPNETDPKTGQPIPTTTTPVDKKACDRAAEIQRKAAEEQEKTIKKHQNSTSTTQ